MRLADLAQTSSPESQRKAEVLSEALPFMRRYAGRTFVVKFGGHAMGGEAARSFAQDVVLLKQIGINPVVVHGGGPQIAAMLERLAIPTSFVDGLRVTDKATMEVVEMVLSGLINKQLVAAINDAGGRAVGLSGKDGNLITARKLRRMKRDPETGIDRILDLGFVGEPAVVNPEILETFEESEIIPVIAPIGIGGNGETYNINADTAAGAIAGAIGATRLMMLTDVPGVLTKDKQLIAEMTLSEARALIEDGTISGGMIPKVENCMDAVDTGVEGAVIVDGRQKHPLLLEMFTGTGAGTLIVAD